MKFLLTFLLTVLTLNCSRGQEKAKQDLFEPFNIIMVKPGNARIPDSLKIYADSIERSQQRMYSNSIKAFDKMREKRNDEDKKEIDVQIERIKLREKEIKNFKYYHSIADRTLFELRILFNTNETETDATLGNPILEGIAIDYTTDLKNLRKRYNVDYIVTFDNIYVDRKKGVSTLNYVTRLFWTKKNKVILKKKIEGNAPVNNYKSLNQIFPPGNIHEHGVYCGNYLECMIKSAVRFSTEELFKTISNKQKK